MGILKINISTIFSYRGQTLTVRLMYLMLLAVPLVNISVGNVKEKKPIYSCYLRDFWYRYWFKPMNLSDKMCTYA